MKIRCLDTVIVPEKKNKCFSSGRNHLIARAVGGKADEDPIAAYSDRPRKNN